MKNKNIVFALIIIILAVILGVLLKCLVFTGSSKTNNMQMGFETLNEANGEVEEIKASASQEDKRGEVSYSDYTCKINLDSLEITGIGATVNDGTITISTGGIYYFSGTLADGNIVINARDNDNVILVFDNVSISCSKTAVINGVNAKNIYINLVDGTTNTFTDGTEYTEFTEDDEPNGTIFSKTDLLINGTGKMIVNSYYEDGIVSKDDLIITNAIIEVTSADDGIRGKDSVDIKDAVITVISKEDGIKSNNDEDDSKGYVIIDNSTITVKAGDDGIHSEKDLIISSGIINIEESNEGLEGMFVQINGGTINVKASDDGINGTDGSSSSELGMGIQNSSNSNVQIQINGGTIYVDADGDGLDANGTILMTGGTVTVAGTSSNGNGALDFDCGFKVTGGNLVVYGASGMWQNPSLTSEQYSLCFGINGSSGDEIIIKDEEGDIISEFKTDKTYGAILVSNDSLKDGNTYTLYINGEEKSSLKIESIVTSNLENGGMMVKNRQNINR